MHDGIDLRKVKRIGLASIVIVIVVVGAAAALTARWDEDPPGGAIAPPRAWISGPLLETSPRADLAHYLQEKNRLLHEYGWVDRKAGIARIPLDQAMRAMAEQAGAARADGGAAPGRPLADSTHDSASQDEPAGTAVPGANAKGAP